MFQKPALALTSFQLQELRTCEGLQEADLAKYLEWRHSSSSHVAKQELGLMKCSVKALTSATSSASRSRRERASRIGTVSRLPCFSKQLMHREKKTNGPLNKTKNVSLVYCMIPVVFIVTAKRKYLWNWQQHMPLALWKTCSLNYCSSCKSCNCL